MYHWIEDKDFLNRSYGLCADIVNQLVQHLKKYDIDAAMSVVGSKRRNMSTQNGEEYIDFDFDLLIGNADDFRSGRDLKEVVRKAFNEVLSANDMEDCDDSKSALTTKPIYFTEGNPTSFYMDLCIVKRDRYGFHRLIHQKTGFVDMDQWYWNMVPDSRDLREREAALKPDFKYWTLVRQTYLDKKNLYLRRPYDHDHPSFVCYIEAVNEVYEKARRGVI